MEKYYFFYRTVVFSGIIAWLLFSCKTAAQDSQTKNNLSSRCVLTGKVLDEYGEPIPATIIVLKYDGGSFGATANVDGRYLFDDLPCNKTFNVHVEAISYFSKDMGNITVDQNSEEMSFQLMNHEPIEEYYEKRFYGKYYFKKMDSKKIRFLGNDDYQKEKEIWTSAFKYCIKKYEIPDETTRYYLCVGWDHNADRKLIRELQTPGMIVKKGSASTLTYFNSVIDKKTRETGSRITIFGITKHSEVKVTLFVCYFASGLGYETQEIYLEKIEGKWIVTGDRVFEMG